ncbi:hypothetical protein F5Y19DRAFT_67278 [Xylariaceae sp. FL1651]|nr:hypothetical protein F5Y19DRAFT_67278 [Xylariaceae sp. FL1651]
MANLPSQHPNLVLHLTDRAMTSLITSARAQPQLQSLTALSHIALNAHESALRLGLGIPQRIMVEHGDGPVFLQTFLSPHPATTTLLPPHDYHTTRQSAIGPDTGLSAAAAQLALLSVSGANGGAQQSEAQTQNPRQRQQHQGALSLAAESRGAAPTSSNAAAYLRGGAATDDDEEHEHSVLLGDETDLDEEVNPDAPPMLVGIVVAPSSDETLEARRAAARLERVGREIQAQWTEAQGQTPISQGQGREDGQLGAAAAAD